MTTMTMMTGDYNGVPGPKYNLCLNPYWIDRLYYEDMIDMTPITYRILIGYLYGSMSYLIPTITVSGKTGLNAIYDTVLTVHGTQFRYSGSVCL